MEPESKSEATAGGVIRRNRKFVRYYPFFSGSSRSSVEKEELKKEVIRLGVQYSLSLVQSMFLLCDDVRTMLSFCRKFSRYGKPEPVLERLLLIMHYVYLSDIEPKKGVYKNNGQSVQWSLISTTWEDFSDGVLVMHTLVWILGRKNWSFDDRLFLTAIAKFKQVLQKLEDKLRPVKDVSEANGFARETIETIIYDLWKSIFDEKPKEATETLKAIRRMTFRGIFGPILGQPLHREIGALIARRPYIFGRGFIKQELKEEVVQLGVELSLLVAQSIFLLRDDDVRSMLWFQYKLWRDAIRDRDPHSLVVERLISAIYHIKPNYSNDDRWDQWASIKTTMKDFAAGIRHLDCLVLILRGQGRYAHGREFTSRIEESLKNVDDKLRCAKDRSEAIGFARDLIKSNTLDLWKSLFDKEVEKAWKPKVMKRIGFLTDLFRPLFKETVEKH